MRPVPRRGLKILHVGRIVPNPGGSSLSSSDLLVAFARMGHAVRALAPITPEALASGDAFAADHPEIGVTRFLLPFVRANTYYPLSQADREVESARIQEHLPALIDTDPPHVVVIGQEDYSVDVPPLVSARSIPCVLRIGGPPVLGMVQGAYPRDLVATMLQRFRTISLLVVQARHMAHHLERLGCANVRIIPNGVDLDRFAPRPKSAALLDALGIRREAIVAAHVSNLGVLKRPMDVVASAVLALRRNPDLTYLIVGDGEPREAMEAACHHLGIASSFRFVGWVDHARLPEYVNLADIVLAPSDAEHQARIYLETQACGRVLVASDIPGAREVVEDGETGLLFTRGDVGDLTAKTLRAAGDPGLRDRIGRRARERVEATHGLDRTVAGFLSALRAVAGGRRPPTPAPPLARTRPREATT